jgi:predicted 3-demethylubiquinone-9 3-methyltransferase (glyoxalase superfamily)
MPTPRIRPCLWFDGNAEEAMNFYCSVFPSSKVLNVSHANGKVLMCVFELEGEPLMALNGGPEYHFTEALSLFVDCKDQQEVDRLWSALGEGGEDGQCGWLKDRFGLSWQIVPAVLPELLGGGGDPARANRVLQAMLKMKKLDVAGLRRAYDGR